MAGSGIGVAARGAARRRPLVVAALRVEVPRRKDAAAWVVALHHHVAVAEENREALTALPGFDRAQLEAARRLIAVYDEGDGRRPGLLVPQAALITVVGAYVARVQSAARFAFRNHPALAAEATSSRLRRQAALAAQSRRRNRRAAEKAAKVAAEAKAAEARPAEPAVAPDPT